MEAQGYEYGVKLYQADATLKDDAKTDVNKAYVKLATLKNAALLALRNVYQVASHTFHVYLWDLLPGARENASHVFTQFKEGRNQYLVQAKQAEAAGLKLRPHSAKDTLTFLHKHFVKENCD